MSVGPLVPLQEYLRSSYSPDREYCDGALVERNMGDRTHAALQAALAAFFRRRPKQWDMEVYTEPRIRISSARYRIPVGCVSLTPFPTDRFPARPPSIWIEILSADDAMLEVWNKAREAVAFGTPYVWIIDPNTLESELFTAAGGPVQVTNTTLRMANPPLAVSLPEVLEE